MIKDVLFEIAKKYFEDCSLDSDFFQYLDHKVDFSNFIGEVNAVCGTTINVDEIVDLKYIYNSLSLIQIADIFNENYKNRKEKKEIQVERDNAVSKEFDNIICNLERYKEEKEQSVSSSLIKNCDDISQIEQQIILAIENAKEAYAKSDEAKQIKASIFSGNKDAIESLQKAVIKLAEAGETQVTALMAQLIYLHRVARVTKDILALGVSNIDSIRTLIAKIEAKINDPKAKLDNIGKNELIKLLAELKQKEDIYSRVEKQKDGLLAHEKAIIQHSKDIDSIMHRLDILEKGEE